MFLKKLLGLTTISDGASASREAEDTDTMRRIASEFDEMDPARARYLAAFAYILGRVAHADSTVSDVETRAMQEIVQDLGHLTEAQAVLVVEIAKSQVRLFGATENYLVVRRFKEMSTPTQRTELLDCVFAICAADASISVLEEGQAGQIARELGLSHDEFVAARVTYQQHLESVKRLRQTQRPDSPDRAS